MMFSLIPPFLSIKILIVPATDMNALLGEAAMGLPRLGQQSSSQAYSQGYSQGKAPSPRGFARAKQPRFKVVGGHASKDM